MSLYLKKQLQLRIAQDEEWKHLAFVRGSEQTSIEDEATLAESQGGQLTIPDGTTDLEVPLGPQIAAGRLLYLATDVQISFKLNGDTNPALDLQPPYVAVAPAVQPPGELFYDGEFSSLHISNASGGPATVFFIIVGA